MMNKFCLGAEKDSNGFLQNQKWKVVLGITMDQIARMMPGFKEMTRQNQKDQYTKE